MAEIKYRINYYSVSRLFEKGNRDEDVIRCNLYETNYAFLSTQNKKNCHLFAQSLKVLKKKYDVDIFKKIFIVLDFEHFNKMEELKKYPNGFELMIDGEAIRFIDFFKSNSMSKNSLVYYINADFYNKIIDRLTFGFHNAEGISLSKWYAYSGLCLTDCQILDKIKFNFDEIAIIEDYKSYVYTSCITAVSVPFLYNKATKLKELINKYAENEDVKIDRIPNKSIEYLAKEIKSYHSSRDMKSNELGKMKEMIKILFSLINGKVSNSYKYFDEIENIYNENNKTGTIKWARIFVQDFPVEINYFDGEGLISKKLAASIKRKTTKNEVLFDEDDQYSETFPNSCHSIQIRLPFIKGMVHSCDFKEFFKEKGITKIKGLTFNSNDPYHEYDVDKLKLILTESQFKMAAFIRSMKDLIKEEYPLKYYFKCLNEYDYSLGISSYEPKKLEHVSLNYQFLSTLPINIKDIDPIIEFNKQILDESQSEEKIIESLRTDKYKGTEIYDVSPEIYKSLSIYKNTKRDIFMSNKQEMMMSHLVVNGCRKLLCGDLLMLLYHCIGKIDESPRLVKNNVYIPQNNFTEDIENIILLRNPHYSRNEISICQVNNNDITLTERIKYFSHLTGVIMVNPEAMIADRLGGADYDGDTVSIVTHQELLISVIPKMIRNDEPVYPIVKIPSISTKRVKDSPTFYPDRIECLRNTFSNKTGAISNLAFNYSFEAYHRNNPTSDKHNEMAFFTILGGLEIDSIKNGRKPQLPSGKGKNDYLIVKDYYKKDNNVTKAEAEISIENILERNTKHVLYYIYDKFNSVKELKDTASIGFNISIKDKMPITQLYTIISIIEANGILDSIIDDYSKGVRNNHEEEKRIIINNVYEILKLNGYNVEPMDIIKNCYTTRASETYLKYFDNEMPYHYLTNFDDKKRFIKKLNLALNSKMLAAVTDFRNGGYKLLYQLLKYHSYESQTIENKLADKEYTINDIKYISKKKTITKQISENDIYIIENIIKEIVSDVFEKICTLLDNGIISTSDLRGVVHEEMKVYCECISLEELCSVTNYKQTDLIYYAFKDKLIELIKENQNEKAEMPSV